MNLLASRDRAERLVSGYLYKFNIGNTENMSSDSNIKIYTNSGFGFFRLNLDSEQPAKDATRLRKSLKLASKLATRHTILDDCTASMYHLAKISMDFMQL